MRRTSPAPALGLALVAAAGALACALHAKESIRPNGPEALRAGASHEIGGWRFQYLGTTEAGAPQWLFPHLDGVPEIFEAPADAKSNAEWTGAFGSRFDPRNGRFENLFNAAEVLNEFLRPGLEAPQRRVRARLLTLWIALHGGEDHAAAPHWLAEYAKDLAQWTTPGDEAWLAKARAYYRDAYAKVARAGTELPAFAAPFDPAQGPAAYHRALLRDGYLDVALVGGNLYDEQRGLYKSWMYVDLFCKRLKRMGFRASGFRGSREETFLYKAVKILGQPVVVRVNATGGSTRDYRIRRGVANFEEGLAHADVFVYHGHSNLMEGSYWISETNDEYSRFRIGLDDQTDLGAKCHGLNRRPYQFAGLQSCSSFQKYARPILRYYANELKDAPGATGFLGTADFCYHADLVPRYGALLEGLFAAEGPRTILERVNALKPMPQSPPFVARGFLQPRFTFVVPQGVSISKIAERGPGDVQPLMLADGEGSDGRSYVSTECFPQDSPGEIVQLVEMPGAVFGLTRGGRVYECSARTKGAPEPARFAGRGAAFTYLARVTDGGAPALVLLGRDGKVYARAGENTNGEKLLPVERQAPDGTAFDLLGEADDGSFVARGTPATWFAWDAKAKRYAQLDAAPKLRNETPSLAVPGSSGARGALWQPRPCPRNRSASSYHAPVTRPSRRTAMPALPKDYAERVYAGVLGKLIGVYLGRPFEGWSHEKIMKELGEIRFYVHERLGKKLVITDDDISGTFTFARALADFGYPRNLSAEQIGQTWLNYIVEKKTILWWGGMGISTEHTAFQRLKHGIPAPKSGSIELNGQVVAEQIGSQIFIDGWALAAPGDPELAADLAKKASSVSHDGEAIHGAVALAVMEALAFNESRIEKLFDEARRFVPADCTIRKMTDDIRNWAASGEDWRKTRGRIEAHYGYDKFGGGCHMIPNHGVIVLALVHGRDDFQESLLVANTAGWDTDCNSGNVGCLLGIKNGLAGIEAGPDWRGPVADRLFLPTADGGRCLTDAVRESYEIVRAGCALAGEAFEPPKGGARYHFDLPGAVQGWRFEDSPDCHCIGTAWNAAGHSAGGTRSLAIGYCGLAPGRAARAAVPVFVTPDCSEPMNYELLGSPALYSGQTVKARIEADAHNARAADVRLYVRHYDGGDKLVYLRSPDVALAPGKDHEFVWRVPDTGGQPIAEIGVEVTSDAKAAGTVYLDWLDWQGAPDVRLGVPDGAPEGTPRGTMWQRAWVVAADIARFHQGLGDFRMAQDRGAGLLIQGTREWAGYRALAAVQPHLAKRAGIAVCVQGLERYYALLLSPEDGGKVQLIKRHYGEKVLAEAKFPWTFDRKIELALATDGGKLRASVDDKPLLAAQDTDAPYAGGAVALVCEEGCVNFGAMHVKGQG